MPPDVNIHVKTEGAQQAKQDLQGVAQATEEMGAKSSRAAGWIKEAFTALIGPLSITAAVGLVVGAVRKIVAAFDDMKRASAEAVHELANQQRAAASFFESVNAYSGPQRKVALAQARDVQERTGLPFESSMQLLEAQQRSFGEINPQSTDQFAAYWKLHAGAQTPNLVRWMGASGIKTPEQQGQIMRMIGAAGQGKISEEQIIEAIAGQSERFKAMGWSPEQTITNIGKLLTGMSAEEAPKALRGVFGAIEGFDEAKAIEMKAPKQVAESEQARLEWLQTKTAGMPLKQRNTLLRQAFGPTYPYVNKMLFEPTSPEMQQDISYAKSSQAAAEDAKNAAAALDTAEGKLESAKGTAGKFDLDVTDEESSLESIREIGKAYLEKTLRQKDRFQYEKLMYMPEELRYEKAALMLWRTTHPGIPKTGFYNGSWGPTTVMEQQDWGNEPEEQQLSELRSAANEIHLHYHNETIYNPVAGTAADRDQGPRVNRDFK